MKIIMMGCEYVGKTTLGAAICDWMKENFGRSQFGEYIGWHDHFVAPDLTHEGPNSEVYAEHMQALPPSVLEHISQQMILYHFEMLQYDHNLVINWYYGDAVYAPLYYGYGNPGEGTDVRLFTRICEAKLTNMSPETALVLVKASPEVIRQRMRENPHPRCVLKDEDVELVLERFEEQYNLSILRRKFTIDTTEASVEDSLREFVAGMEPNLTLADRLAILTHEKLKPSLPV